MERIFNKQDYNDNKARPGAVWVSGFNNVGRNDHIRAVDPDGSEMRFTPESRYYASCTIKRGQAVSIAQLNDLSKEQKGNKYPYVKLTDPDLDDSCLGIALNYAEEGQIVHIQNKGKFNYYTTESPYYTDKTKDSKGLTMKDKEIFLESTNWDFSGVRGQKLYIKKLYHNTTDSGSSDLLKYKAEENEGDVFDTDHPDLERGVDDTDLFTFDLHDSIYNAKNTIQVGYLTDAPTEKSNNLGYKRFATGTDIYYCPIKRDEKTSELFVDTNEKINGIWAERGSDGKWYNTDNKKFLDHADSNWVFKSNKTLKVGKENVEVFFSYDDFIVTIELDVTGDTRGPIDNTQFILTLGEDIYLYQRKQDVDLEKIEKSSYVYGPDFNEGIYDEIKVVAIAEGHARPPVFKVFTTTGLDSESSPNLMQQEFIAVRKMDGDTYIIPLLKDFDSISNGDLINAQDAGYYSLSESFTSLTNEDRMVEIKIGDPVLNINNDSLKEALTKALAFVFVDPDTGEKLDESNIVIEDIGDDGFSITTKTNGGYYDLYVSEDMLSFISIKNEDHGQAAEQGEAILADIRDRDRLNIAGVVITGTSGLHRKGERIKVMKMGRMVTRGNLWPGKNYYLGLNGRITARKEYWYDNHVKIGIADSANYFIVDCANEPLRSYSGNLPIGYMRPSVRGIAEKGYLLMDGVTLYPKQGYEEIYLALQQWFSIEELKPSYVNQEKWEKQLAVKYMEAFKEVVERFEMLDDFTGEIDELKERVDAIETKNEEQDAAIKAADDTAKIEALKKLLEDKLDQQTASLEKEIQDLETGLTNLFGDQISETYDVLSKRITELKNGESADIASVRESLSELSNKLLVVQEDLEEKISSNKTKIVANQKSIADLQNSLDSEQTKINELIESSLETNRLISELQGGMMNETEEEIQKMQEEIQKLQTENGERSEEITNLRSNISSIQGRINDLVSQNEELNQSIADASEELDAKKLDKEKYEEKLTELQSVLDSIEEKIQILSLVTVFQINGKDALDALPDGTVIGTEIILDEDFLTNAGVSLPESFKIVDGITGGELAIGSTYTLRDSNSIKIIDTTVYSFDDSVGDSF